MHNTIGQSDLRQAARRAGVSARPYRHISDRRVFATIALDYGIVLVTASVATLIHQVPITLLALLVIAGRRSALQGLVHSACHYSLFARRRWNDGLEFLFAYPILDSVSLYREQHMEHHRDFERKTPDRFDYLLKSLALSRASWWDRTWLVFIRPLLGHAGWVFIADTWAAYRDNPRRAAPLIAFWTATVSVAWWGGWLWPLFLYWVVPLVWLYPVLDIWSELSDHLDAKAESRNQEGFFYSALVKGHETFHAVHHVYPFVPFYRLHALNDEMQRRGVVIESARGPHDFLGIVYGAVPTRQGVLAERTEHRPQRSALERSAAMRTSASAQVSAEGL